MEVAMVLLQLHVSVLEPQHPIELETKACCCLHLVLVQALLPRYLLAMLLARMLALLVLVPVLYLPLVLRHSRL